MSDALTGVNAAGSVDTIRASAARSRPVIVSVKECPRSTPRGWRSVKTGGAAKAETPSANSHANVFIPCVIFGLRFRQQSALQRTRDRVRRFSHDTAAPVRQIRR